MINSFRMLGKSIFQKAGYYDTEDENLTREIYLKTQSILPEQRGDRAKNAIAINFNTQKREFTFEWDKEITPGNRDYFFAFSVGSSNDKKKFLSTNNMRSFYKKVFNDSLTFLEEGRKTKKTQKWFSDNISEDYDKFIEQIRDTFYVKEGKDYTLNKEMLSSNKKELLREIENNLQKKQKKASEPIPLETLYSTFINKSFFSKEGKSEVDFPPVILAKIDGKSILEYLEYKNLKSSYINLVYYDLFERFFIENAQKEKICHICARNKEVIGEIPLPMKFYGITNYLYFENLKNQVAYRSFSICRECLTEVLTGMRYTSNELRDWILGITCYLVPSMETEEENFENRYKGIFKLLNKKEGYQKDIEEIDKLVKKSAWKNFYFNLLFFDSLPGSQVFNILKLISNIEYQKLVSKMALFHEINKTYELSLLKNSSISLNDVGFHLFPSASSHGKKPDPALYRKDILDLLEAFLQGYPMNYHMLIKRFMHIYRLKFHRNNTDALATFKMVLLLSIFNKIKPLKGVKAMEDKTGNTVTEIQNEDYRKFIEEHQVIYEKNFHRQGLFLLGTVINSIINAQKKKFFDKGQEVEALRQRRKLSSTFMRKLNFSGIPARRVNRLVGEVQNFYQIYNKDIYEEPGIWGNIMDRLQGIEESFLNPEEIVFYILTGISYASYIGMKKGMEKKEGK